MEYIMELFLETGILFWLICAAQEEKLNSLKAARKKEFPA